LLCVVQQFPAPAAARFLHKQPLHLVPLMRLCPMT
jgi:hypothetical protein